MLMPILDKLAREYDGKFQVAKVDTESERELATTYGVRSLPTVKVFRDGVEVDEFMGALPESGVREVIDRHICRPADNQIASAASLADNDDLLGADLTAVRHTLDRPGLSQASTSPSHTSACGG